MSKQYDTLVIGSGTAGQTAAYELNRNGLTVGMVEHSQRPGGTCALSGCQAKKWFFEGVETVARSRHLEDIGITTAAVASWLDLRDAKNQFTSRVPDNTVNGLKQAGIDLIGGGCSIHGPTCRLRGPSATVRPLHRSGQRCGSHATAHKRCTAYGHQQ